MFSSNVSSEYLESGMSIFSNYFYRKSSVALVVKLTEDMLKQQGGDEFLVGACADAAYLAMVIYHGSISTSGTGYVVSTLLQLMGCSADKAWWGSFIASTAVCLTLDATPWGVLATIISTAGGELGKDTALTFYTAYKARQKAENIPAHRVKLPT